MAPFLNKEEYYMRVEDTHPQLAFKLIADWVADETTKRRYPHEEVVKLSEALIILDKFFEQYKEVFE